MLTNCIRHLNSTKAFAIIISTVVVSGWQLYTVSCYWTKQRPTSRQVGSLSASTQSSRKRPDKGYIGTSRVLGRCSYRWDIQKLTYLWSALGSTRTRHRRTVRFRRATAWRSFAFACFGPGMRRRRSDSTWWTASIWTRCGCGQTGNPRAPEERLTGKDLLEAEGNWMAQDEHENE